MTETYNHGKPIIVPAGSKEPMRLDPRPNGKKLPRVFIGLPARPGENLAAFLYIALRQKGDGFELVDEQLQPSSLLTNNFNHLWCRALNMRPRPTHFLLVHSDVAPEPGRWVTDLLSEMERVNADVLSSVIAIKDERGLASCGVFDWKTKKMRQFSVSECLKFPRTFDAAGSGHPGKALLMNTGCLLVRFDRPWVKRICFRFYDTIIERADGTFDACSVSEDYLFSIDCFRLGLRTFCTTTVKVHHYGPFRYPNCANWGTQEGTGQWGTPWCVMAPPSWHLDWPEGAIRD